jgi:hypothetical protein
VIRWYAGSDVVEPEAVECPVVGFPERDSKGRIQYENSHYNEQADAWGHILANAEAWVGLAGTSVASSRRALEKANEQAGEAAEHFARVRRGFDAWQGAAVPPEPGR